MALEMRAVEEERPGLEFRQAAPAFAQPVLVGHPRNLRAMPAERLQGRRYRRGARLRFAEDLDQPAFAVVGFEAGDRLAEWLQRVLQRQPRILGRLGIELQADGPERWASRLLRFH